MSWFQELFGRAPGERVGREFLTIDVGQTVIVTVENDHPRIIRTRFGRRAVLDVKTEDGEERTLILSHVDLAEKIALIEQERGSLSGLKLKISRLPSTGRKALYQVEVLEG